MVHGERVSRAIVIISLAVFWIVSTWVAVPGWSDPLDEGGRFHHASQIMPTAIGVVFLCVGIAVYRHKGEGGA